MTKSTLTTERLREIASEVTTKDGENCWSCGKYFTYSQRAECDGYCPHCNAPVDLGDEAISATATTRPAVIDERLEFESFMENRFRDSVNRSRVVNGDREYFAWDMQVAWRVWQGRATMLQPVSSGYKLVPRKLTAENGAKSALIGEFTEIAYIDCTECIGDDNCEACDGSGRMAVHVPVSWTTIKAIWSKAIEHFDSTEPKP